MSTRFTGKPHSRVTPERKAEILKRDGRHCRYCGRSEPLMVIDHVLPVSQGGTNRYSNLVTACHTCDQNKGSRFIKPMALACLLERIEVGAEPFPKIIRAGAILPKRYWGVKCPAWYDWIGGCEQPLARTAE